MMPALKNPYISVGEKVNKFTYLTANGQSITSYGSSDDYSVTDFGVLMVTPSGNTKILIPWNRVTEVWL